jgi:hypothetical protein
MDFVLDNDVFSIKMNIARALDKVVTFYPPGILDIKVFKTPSEEDSFWIVEVRNTEVPDSLLQIEVFDDNGVPKCCVTKKLNIGRRSMFKFMNDFVDALEESYSSETTS